MKKILSISVMVIMVIVGSFVLTGCGNQENNNIDKDNGISEKNDNQVNNNNGELGIGEYKVEKRDNTVCIITRTGASLDTTEYIYIEDDIQLARVIQKYSSSQMASISYDTLKSEPTIAQLYEDINLDGDTITLKMKEELILAYKDMDADTLYNYLKQIYGQ